MLKPFIISFIIVLFVLFELVSEPAVKLLRPEVEVLKFLSEVQFRYGFVSNVGVSSMRVRGVRVRARGRHAVPTRGRRGGHLGRAGRARAAGGGARGRGARGPGRIASGAGTRPRRDQTQQRACENCEHKKGSLRKVFDFTQGLFYHILLISR